MVLLTSLVSPIVGAPDANGWSYVETQRIKAAEASQGVATDGEYLYAISNRAIGKYRCDTGERVAGWSGNVAGPIIHLNAGQVWEGMLYCAHSNYPGVPNCSSVEIWDTATMRHVGSHSFGLTDGSLTWLVRHDDRWIACFAQYGRKGGEPGRNPSWTRLVAFDDGWREVGGWSFPQDLMERLGVRGYSISGGGFGPEGLLFVTGHDDPFLYVLRLPEAGPVLQWVATIPVPSHGQAFAWNPLHPGQLCTINRGGHEIIMGTVRASQAAAH